MSMAYIRKSCPQAKVGARIRYQGKFGTIKGAAGHLLKIVLDGQKSYLTVDPKQVEYV